MAEEKTKQQGQDKPASGILDSLGEWISDNPTLVGSLLGGGLGGVAGYFLPDENDEALNEEDRFQERLKRALILGGIGAGGGGLIGYGFGQLGSSVDKNRNKPENYYNKGVDFADKAWNVAKAPATTGVAVGAGGTYLAHKALQNAAKTSASPYLGNASEARTAVNAIKKAIGEPPLPSSATNAEVLAEAESLRVRATASNASSKLKSAVQTAYEGLGRGKGFNAGVARTRWMGAGGPFTRGPVVRTAGKGIAGIVLGLLANAGADYLWGEDEKKDDTTAQ